MNKAPGKVMGKKMALCGAVYKLRIDDRGERERVAGVLAANGYPVWTETVEAGTGEDGAISVVHYLCYMDEPQTHETLPITAELFEGRTLEFEGWLVK